MVDYKFATGEERKTPKLVGNPASLNLVLPLQIPTCQKQGINLMDKAPSTGCDVGDVTACGHAGLQKLGPAAPIGDRLTARVHGLPSAIMAQLQRPIVSTRQLSVPWISRDLHGHSRPDNHSTSSLANTRDTPNSHHVLHARRHANPIITHQHRLHTKQNLN